jgi:hypothetical protein
LGPPPMPPVFVIFAALTIAVRQRFTLARHSGAPHCGEPGTHIPAARMYGFRVPAGACPRAGCRPDPGVELTSCKVKSVGYLDRQTAERCSDLDWQISEVSSLVANGAPQLHCPTRPDKRCRQEEPFPPPAKCREMGRLIAASAVRRAGRTRR